MKPATTTIRVCGDEWQVPRGFGATYRHHAQLEIDAIAAGDLSTLSDMLLLIGYSVSVEVLAHWDLRKRVEASVYAANAHARASDNPIQRHPKPEWLPEAWEGPPAERPPHIRADLWGAFDGPTGTVLT